MTSVIEVHDLTKGERQRSRCGWLAITGLLLLSALPVLGGVLRLRGVSADPRAHSWWPHRCR